VRADKVQKELDVAAFNEATKQADDQLEKQQRGNEQPAAPRPH